MKRIHTEVSNIKNNINNSFHYGCSRGMTNGITTDVVFIPVAQQVITNLTIVRNNVMQTIILKNKEWRE